MGMSSEDFIRIWQASKSHAEVARACEISANSAASRASRLRARGVSLKRFRVCAPLDYKALAAMAEEFEANPRLTEEEAERIRAMYVEEQSDQESETTG